MFVGLRRSTLDEGVGECGKDHHVSILLKEGHHC